MQQKTLIRCAGTENWGKLLPGTVALNAMTTAIVLAKTQDIQSAKVMPNAVWRSIHDHSEGCPMKVSEQRKHIVSEKSSRRLSSMLLAFTSGVSLK